MANLQRINPTSLAKPSGFSHAVIARGTTIDLTGETDVEDLDAIVAGSIKTKFEQALAKLLTVLQEWLANLLLALGAAGGTPDGLASLTIYIVDMDDYRAHARELGEV